MNDIQYTYEITKKDLDARVMEVIYESEGRPPVHVGARLPFVGETVESVVAMFAPLSYWAERDSQVIDVVVGAKGVGATSGAMPPVNVDTPAPTLDDLKELKRLEINRVRYVREVSGVVVNGNPVDTDRETQVKVTGALAAMQAGFVTAVDWKFSSGRFVTLRQPEIETIAKAIAQHVQDCFTWERVLAEAVSAATTIEELNAVEIPGA